MRIADLPPPLLLFPTHYLGNLVLGLPWVLRVLERRTEAIAVFDAAFRPLLSMVPGLDARAMYYPRKELAREQRLGHRLGHYLRFLGELRQYRGHRLIDLEGERFSGVLARLSGCRERIGPAAKRANWFYSEVSQLDYLAHRHNAFGEILGSYGVGDAPQHEIDFQVAPSLAERVAARLPGRLAGRPLVIVHPGASVSYKLWPGGHFARLVEGLAAAGLQPIWIGAGALDAGAVASIEGELPQPMAINLCDRLDFPELVALFRQASLYVGCDSGPMHLAAATGLPVFALFGPSREAIWAPRGARSTVLRGATCAEDCDAWHCRSDYHCLRALTPEMVLCSIAKSMGSDQEHR